MYITNTLELAALIERETSDKDTPEVRNFMKEARWFIAYQMAEDMHQDYTIKDWAHFVLEGMQPLTEKDVEEWLVDEEEGPLWTEKSTAISIRRFYGIK